MLNGIAPIMLFSFVKSITIGPTSKLKDIPLVADIILKDKVVLIPIPVYLDENLTGLCILSESKNIDIATELTTLGDSASDPAINQTGFSSTVTISMKAKRGSIGLSLLGALMDVVFKKVTAKEYTITYMHGSIAIFGALLHSFEINDNEDNELSEVKIVLVNPAKQKLSAFIPNLGGDKLQTAISAVKPG